MWQGSLIEGIFGGASDWKNIKHDRQMAGKDRQWREAMADIEHQRVWDYDRGKWQNIAEGAEIAGIHPLAAIGANVSSYRPQAVGLGHERAKPRGGSGMRSIGRGLGELLNKKMTQSQQKLALKREEAEIKLIETRTEALEKEVNSPTQGHPPLPEYQGQADWFTRNQGDISKYAVVNEPKRQIVKSQLGTEAGKSASDQFIETPTGLKRVLSERVADTYESDAFEAVHRFVVKGWEASNMLSAPTTHWIHDRIKNRRPGKYYPVPKGYEYRYNILDREYQMQTIGPEGSQAFVHPWAWRRKKKSKGFPNTYREKRRISPYATKPPWR